MPDADAAIPDATDRDRDRDTRSHGVAPHELEEHQLIRELETIHRTRHDTLLHGAPAALAAHNTRMAELEGEYLRRHPERMVSPGRTRDGARERG